MKKARWSTLKRYYWQAWTSRLPATGNTAVLFDFRLSTLLSPNVFLVTHDYRQSWFTRCGDPAPQSCHMDKDISPTPVMKFRQSRIPHIWTNVLNGMTRRNVPILIGVYGTRDVLHYEADQVQRDSNRDNACGDYNAQREAAQDGDPIKDLSCDEYPMASTKESQNGATIQGVPLIEQHRQGGTMSAFYKKHGMFDGKEFFLELAP